MQYDRTANSYMKRLAIFATKNRNFLAVKAIECQKIECMLGTAAVGKDRDVWQRVQPLLSTNTQMYHGLNGQQPEVSQKKEAAATGREERPKRTRPSPRDPSTARSDRQQNNEQSLHALL